MSNTETKQGSIMKKRHFEEKKMDIIQHVQNIQYGYLSNKYKMGHLEGNFTPVLYMGRKVPKRLTWQRDLLDSV